MVAVSLEDRDTAAKSQAQFPHLTFVADADRGLSKPADVVGPHHGPEGQDTTAPTTILIDRHGIVRWIYRPDRYIRRLTPDELLAAIDEHIPREP